MELVHQTTEENKTYRWYACRKVSCRQELLHIKADTRQAVEEAARAGP
jgi:hypothetical protein